MPSRQRLAWLIALSLPVTTVDHNMPPANQPVHIDTVMPLHDAVSEACR